MIRKCFCCDKKLGRNPFLVDTRDGQFVFVGSECFKIIKKSINGYKPPKGGPTLYTLRKGYTQQELEMIFSGLHPEMSHE